MHEASRQSTDCRHAKQEVISGRKKPTMPEHGFPTLSQQALVRFQHGPAALAAALPETIVVCRRGQIRWQCFEIPCGARRDPGRRIQPARLRGPDGPFGIPVI